MGKMSLTSCRALSTPGKFSNVDRYGLARHFDFDSHMGKTESQTAM